MVLAIKRRRIHVTITTMHKQTLSLIKKQFNNINNQQTIFVLLPDVHDQQQHRTTTSSSSSPTNNEQRTTKALIYKTLKVYTTIIRSHSKGKRFDQAVHTIQTQDKRYNA